MTHRFVKPLLSALVPFASLLIAPAAAEATAAPGPWEPATKISTPGVSSTDPEIAIAADGTAVALWSEFNGTTVATRAPGSGSWSTETLLSGGTKQQQQEFAIAPDGAVTVVWSEEAGADSLIYAATRPAGAASFIAPVAVSAAGKAAEAPDVAIAPDGTTMIVWRYYQGVTSTIAAAVHEPGSGSWAASGLTPDSDNYDGPQVAFGPDGTATVTWAHDDGTSAVIEAMTRPPGGSFGGLTALTSASWADDQQLAVAADGTATIAWTYWDSDAAQNQVWAASRPAGGSFAAAEKISRPDEGSTPELAVNPDGAVAAIWQDTQYRVQAASRPAGADGFEPPAAVSPPIASGSDPAVTLAPDGTTTVAWAVEDDANGVLTVFVQAASRPPGAGRAFGPTTDLSGAINVPLVHIPSAIALASASDGTTTALWSVDGAENPEVWAATTAAPPALSVSRSGSGSGAITSSPAAIDCGPSCSAKLTVGSEVTLTAAADAGSTFSGWGGDCAGTGPSCTLQMSADRNVTATFTADPPPPPPPPPPPVGPTKNTAIFDGQRLSVTVRCGHRFKPACRIAAAPVIGKGEERQEIAEPVKARVRSGERAEISFLVKRRYREQVAAMADKGGRPLHVHALIGARKIGGKRADGKPRTVQFHHSVELIG